MFDCRVIDASGPMRSSSVVQERARREGNDSHSFLPHFDQQEVVPCKRQPYKIVLSVSNGAISYGWRMQGTSPFRSKWDDHQ